MGFVKKLLCFSISCVCWIGVSCTYLNLRPESLNLKRGETGTFNARIRNYSSRLTELKIQLKIYGKELSVDPEYLYFNISSESSEIPVSVIGYECGRGIIYAANDSEIDNVNEAFVRITVFRYEVIKWIVLVTGWIYVVSWSLSFYPQIVTNWKRKSVEGFNLDFVALNWTGHLSYLFFNCGLFWIPLVKRIYFSKHKHGVNPVQLNDVLFSLHAVFGTSLQIVQCCFYQRGGQRLSKMCLIVLVSVVIVAITCLVLSILQIITWLSYLYMFSYIKLVITLIKYTPQAYMNYKRRSTDGWNVGYVFLDFIGGINSVSQMLLIAYNYGDWMSLVGDLAKLGLGMFAVSFDIVFLIQHYVLYKSAKSVPTYIDPTFGGTSTHM